MWQSRRSATGRPRWGWGKGDAALIHQVLCVGELQQRRRGFEFASAEALHQLPSYDRPAPALTLPPPQDCIHHRFLTTALAAFPPPSAVQIIRGKAPKGKLPPLQEYLDAAQQRLREMGGRPPLDFV